MKKIISLLLVAVMTLGLLSGMALAADVEKPEECAASDAGVVVTTSEDATAKYYFETLSNQVIAWARQQLPGVKTVTVLKDLTLEDANGYSSKRYINVDGALASWYGRDGAKYPLVIDLGGKTISYTGEANLFFVERFGFTVKNGTILYNGTATRNVITVGTTTGPTAITAGTVVWAPKIVMEDVEVYATAPELASIIGNYVYATEIEIKDSALWTTAGVPINLEMTDQSGLTSSQTAYTGDFTASAEIKDSTIGSASGYVFAATTPDYSVSVSDSILVTNNSNGNMFKADSGLELDTKGQDAAEDAAWTGTVAGNEVSGKAFKYGNAGKIVLPFTDVAETDWSYEFIAEMYAKGVINGMTETTFVPNGTLTYGQALKLIAVGLGKGEQPAGSHWASGYLTLAKNEGWLTADVDLNGSVSRLAFCQIAAKAKGLTEQPASNPFTDTADTSVLALVNAGVINGMTANSFMPDGLLTRAQIAKIISLLVKL